MFEEGHWELVCVSLVILIRLSLDRFPAKNKKMNDNLLRDVHGACLGGSENSLLQITCGIHDKCFAPNVTSQTA